MTPAPVPSVDLLVQETNNSTLAASSSLKRP